MKRINPDSNLNKSLNNMREYQMQDNSIPGAWRDQRNNTQYPHDACNVTAYLMWMQYNKKLDIINWDALKDWCEFNYPYSLKEKDKFKQFEDRLMFYIQINGLRLCKKFTPWFLTPDEKDCKLRRAGHIMIYSRIHAILAGAVNELAKKEIIKFVERMPVDEIDKRLQDGQSLVINGLFQCENGKSYDHIVCLCGITKNKKLYLIDDPYGDWRTNYADHRGNNIVIPRKMLIDSFHSRGANYKWAHAVV